MSNEAGPEQALTHHPRSAGHDHAQAAPPGSFRPMALPDVDAVLAVQNSAPEAPRWTRTNYESFLALAPSSADDPQVGVRRVGFVAEIEGQLRGFAVLRLVCLRTPLSAGNTESAAGKAAPVKEATHEGDNTVGELELIIIDKPARRSGLGRRLMTALINAAIEHGARRIELEVRASNEAAIRLYTRTGLVAEGRRPGYYTSPAEDAILMGTMLPIPRT